MTVWRRLRGYTAAKDRSDPSAIGAGFNRSGSPYCPDPQQWPHGLAISHRVQPAQPDRNADRPLEERHRPQAQISQLPQADHGDPGRPESSEHNDRTRTACLRTCRLTLPLGKGRIPSPPQSMQQRSPDRCLHGILGAAVVPTDNSRGCPSCPVNRITPAAGWPVDPLKRMN